MNKKKGKYRKYIFTYIIESLKQITNNMVKVHNAEFKQIAQPTEEQSKILDLLQVVI